MDIAGRVMATYIDHDIPFSEYPVDEIFDLCNKLPQEPTAIFYRESCGGNTHIKLLFHPPIFEIQSLFVRAIMLDDSRRLRADMERFILRTREINWLFQHKLNLETGEIKSCGEWVKLK